MQELKQTSPVLGLVYHANGNYANTASALTVIL